MGKILPSHVHSRFKLSCILEHLIEQHFLFTHIFNVEELAIFSNFKKLKTDHVRHKQ